MFDTTVTLAFEALFALVFLGCVRDYWRRRDVLSRDLVLIFGAVAALFVVQFVGIVFGSTPPWLAALSALFIFAQPLLTLRLAGRLRHVPRRVMIGAIAAYLLTGLPLFFLPRPIRPEITLAAVAVFAAVEFVAAAYLWLEARRRTGASRVRLEVAAAATALFAGALIVAGSTAATGPAGPALARIVALLAAIGYAIAFIPPAPLRRGWQGMAAYRYGLELADTTSPSGEGADALWQRFADIAREVSGAEAGFVIRSTGSNVTRLGASPARDDAPDAWGADAWAALLATDRLHQQREAEAASTIERDLAGRTGGRFVSTITLPPADRTAVVLVGNHRSLFSSEDRSLIRLLGAQAISIAERAELAAEQARLIEKVFAASQAKSDFIASMSHELRTPLSAILGFSELMRSEPQTAAGRVVPDEWIEHVHTAGQHLLALINDVLDLAKVEAGRLELDRTTFELEALVRETVAGLRPLADRKSIAIDVATTGIPPFTADRGRVRQILYNLLSNAIKFTPERGIIRVAATPEFGDVRISVEDTGPGIAPEDREVIFEEFRQVGDKTGRREGTGLGLALSRRLAEAHGGRIELWSEVGRGSRFTAVFPQAAPIAASAPDPTPLRVAAAQRAGTLTRTAADILIVEDDPSAVRLLHTVLEEDGYAIRVAIDGPSGLAEARRVAPTAIILDVILPGMDGWEVLRELKADATLRDIPVVIVTVVDERGLGLALGAVDYFLKPIDRSALLSRLDRYRTKLVLPSRGVRVLAIDDDPAALDLVEAALAPEGYEVERATGGRDGVDRARAGQFDLIVCDLMMPDADGFEVVRLLKDDPHTAGVPVLILTAHPLTSADKDRLNGEILGIVSKGDDAASGLRDWLRRLTVEPPEEPGARAATA